MVYKRTSKKHGVTWTYMFDAPWATEENRERINKSGFTSKKEAVAAEAVRRVEVEREHTERLKKTDTLPKTLRELLMEFCADSERTHRIEEKTLERYRESIDYIAPELLACELKDVQPLALHREWARLVASGGRGRREGKPLSPKTVRNIVGVVSAAYGRAIFWGLAERNPVEKSEPPRVQRKEAQAISPAFQKTLIDSAGHPALPMILELASATGARRGEVMALRWADIQDGRAVIARVLCQVKDRVFFKNYPKGRRMRLVTLPESTVAALAAHREKQREIHDQFGADYQDGDLIVCQPDGRPLRPNSISSAVSLLCRRLKLPKGVSLHTLRHSQATELLAGGMEITAVAARLGHANTNTTLAVYGHAIRQRDDEAAKLIERSRKDLLPTRCQDREN